MISNCRSKGSYQISKATVLAQSNRVMLTQAGAASQRSMAVFHGFAGKGRLVSTSVPKTLTAMKADPDGCVTKSKVHMAALHDVMASGSTNSFCKYIGTRGKGPCTQRIPITVDARTESKRVSACGLCNCNAC